MRRASSLILALSILGCGSEPLVLPARPALYVDGHISGPQRPFGTLYRDEVARAVHAGLGRFLQHVDLRAVTRQDDTGRRAFVGFEILTLRPAYEWLAFDFVPGDVVTMVDGASVEHYDSVIPVFEGLKAKDKFEITVLRSGAPKTIVVSIRDRGAAAKPN